MTDGLDHRHQFLQRRKERLQSQIDRLDSKIEQVKAAKVDKVKPEIK
jgi:chaperonin cofactor prefoldin